MAMTITIATTSLAGLAVTAAVPAAALAAPADPGAQAHQPDSLVQALETDEARDRVSVVADRFRTLGYDFLALLPLVAASVIVLVVFGSLAKLLTGTDHLFRWVKTSFVRDLVRQVVRLGIIGLGVLVALELLDATALVGAVLGAAGVFGLAIGFAFRDLVENYIASVLLSVRQPFGPNDHVVIESCEGKVVRLTSRATILLTLDGNHVRIPNSTVFKGIILNYTRNPLRRFQFVVGVGVNEDLVRAQTLGVSILRNMDAVLADPPPFVLIETLGDSSVALRFFAWVDQRESDFFKVNSEAIRLVKTAFDAAEIEMPEPIYRVRLVQMSEEAQALAKPVTKAPAAAQMTAGDTSVDSVLDEQIRAERAIDNDLLTDAAPKE